MRAIVEHRGGCESRRAGGGRVTVIEGCDDTVRMLIGDAGADGDDIGGVRDHGGMGNARNEGRDVALGDRIGPARGASSHRTWAPV